MHAFFYLENAVLPLTGLQEDRICIHPEFSSDYREDCFSVAVRKSFCRNNFWRRFLFKLKCISSSADLRFGAISWWISPSARRRGTGRDWRTESRDDSSPIPISGMNSPPKPWI